MRIRASIAAVCLLVIPSALAFPQSSIDIKEVRRLIVYFEIEPGADFSSQQSALLYESLLSSISDASEKVALIENSGEGVPPGDQEKTSYAENNGADSWLHVMVGGDFVTISIRARCLDLLNGLTAFELDLEKELIRGTRELDLLMWREVEEAAADYFDRALNIENRVGDLTFQTLPGTRIKVAGRKPLKSSEEGIAGVEAPLPSTIPFRATKPGYFPIEGQIYMDQPEKLISLEQQLATRLAFDIFLNNMSYPGFDFMYFLVPDMVFARVSVLTYLIGFVLDERDGEAVSMFASHTLNNFGLSFGFFFNDPDRPVRLYTGLGGAWRLITAKGYWGLEPAAPFAAQPFLGLEYSRNQKYKMYAEYAPYFYFAPERYLFTLSLPSAHGGGNVRFRFYPKSGDRVDWAVIWEIFVFNVGLRIRI
jgi:hypothetical protein